MSAAIRPLRRLGFFSPGPPPPFPPQRPATLDRYPTLGPVPPDSARRGCRRLVVVCCSQHRGLVPPGRHSDHAAELPREMALIREPGLGGHVGGPHALPQAGPP